MLKVFKFMDSKSLEEKNSYYSKYKTGRILTIIGFIPIIGFMGIMMYFIELVFSAGTNSPNLSSSNANLMFEVMAVYFPIMMVVMVVCIVSGSYMMNRAIENIVGKSRYDMSPMEYRKASLEVRRSSKKLKSETNLNYTPESATFTDFVKDSNDENTSPFTKK